MAHTPRPAAAATACDPALPGQIPLVTVPSPRDDIIDLVPTMTATGDIVYADPTPDVGTDLVVSGGKLDVVSGDSTTSSRLPQERLAATDPWENILDTVRDVESGRGSRDVVMRAGGRLEVQNKDGHTEEHSRLPQERLAATKPWISSADVAVVRTLDPGNVEGWTPIYTTALDGWRYTLQPRPGGTTFTFLAFRSPQDSGLWRIWVMKPNLDDRFGHYDHMIKTTVAGQVIPIICSRPGQAPCRTLEEARSTSGKWAAYTEAHLMGRAARFSE